MYFDSMRRLGRFTVAIEEWLVEACPFLMVDDQVRNFDLHLQLEVSPRVETRQGYFGTSGVRATQPPIPAKRTMIQPCRSTCRRLKVAGFYLDQMLDHMRLLGASPSYSAVQPQRYSSRLQSCLLYLLTRSRLLLTSIL